MISAYSSPKTSFSCRCLRRIQFIVGYIWKPPPEHYVCHANIVVREPRAGRERLSSALFAQTSCRAWFWSPRGISRVACQLSRVLTCFSSSSAVMSFLPGRVRLRQGTEICNFRAPSPLDSSEFSPVVSPGFLCNLVRKSSQNVEKIARSPGRKNVFGCRVFGVPILIFHLIWILYRAARTVTRDQTAWLSHTNSKNRGGKRGRGNRPPIDGT